MRGQPISGQLKRFLKIVLIQSYPSFFPFLELPKLSFNLLRVFAVGIKPACTNDISFEEIEEAVNVFYLDVIKFGESEAFGYFPANQMMSTIVLSGDFTEFFDEF